MHLFGRAIYRSRCLSAVLAQASASRFVAAAIGVWGKLPSGAVEKTGAQRPPFTVLRRNNTYAGSSHDRRVEKGERFPPSLNNHHFEEK